MMILLNRRVVAQQLFGCAVLSVRANGKQVWASGSGSGPPTPASGHYTHPIWDDTSKLTAPRALLGDPMIIFDIHRNQPAGGFTQSNISLLPGEQVGGDGQTINGRWLTGSGVNTSGSYDGTAAGNLEYPESPVPGGKVWTVDVNGNGADVWLDLASGPPRQLNFQVSVYNCRTFRISGGDWFIDDIRKLAGGWPDNERWEGIGKSRMLHLANMPDDCRIFIEGCNFDMNHGGLPTTPAYRTDVITTQNFSTANSAIIIQNTRIWRVSSEAQRPSTHCDCLQWWRDSLKLGHLHLENTAVYAFYQGFQYDRVYFNSETEPGTHHRLYRHRQVQTNTNPNLSNGALPFWWAYNLPVDDIRVPSIHAEDSSVSWRSAPMYHADWVDSWSGGAGQFRKPTLNATYLNARTDIPLLWAYNNGTDIQSRKANVDENNILEGFSWYDNSNYRGIPPGYAGFETHVPATAIGVNFRHIWDRDGNLLAGEGPA